MRKPGIGMFVKAKEDFNINLSKSLMIGDSIVDDVSHMGEFIVSGDNAKKFLQNVTINDIELLKPGKAQYSAFCNESGGILDDLLIYDLSDHYMLVVNASNIQKNFNWLQNRLFDNVVLKDVSNDMGLLAIQGPMARDILKDFFPKIESLILYNHYVCICLSSSFIYKSIK